MRKLNYIFIVVLAFVSFGAYAQSSVSEIDPLNSVIRELQREKSLLTEQKQSLDKTKTSLTNEAKLLYTDKWCKEVIDNKQKQIVELESTINSYNQTINDNTSKIKEYADGLKKDIDALKEAQSKSGAFNSGLIKQNIDKYIDYTQQPFSKIDLATLDSYRDEVLSALSPEEAKQVIDALDNARILKEKVIDADAVLSQPFDNHTKEDMMNWFDKNKKRFNTEQWDEIYTTTYTYLSRYKNGSLRFRDLLVDIKKAWNESGEDQFAARPKVTEIFEKQTNADPKQNNVERYYKNIPYLWDRYWKIQSILQRRGVKDLINSPEFNEYYEEFSKIKN